LIGEIEIEREKREALETKIVCLEAQLEFFHIIISSLELGGLHVEPGYAGNISPL